MFRKIFTALLVILTGCLTVTYQVPGMSHEEKADVYTRGSVVRVFNQCSSGDDHLYLPDQLNYILVHPGRPTLVHVREGWFQSQTGRNVNFVYRTVRKGKEVASAQHSIYIQTNPQQYDWFVGGQVVGGGNIYHDNIQNIC